MRLFKGLTIFLLVWSVVGVASCAAPSANTADASAPPDLRDLPELPLSILSPSSAEDLESKIKAQCQQETKNVHNTLRCMGRYRTLYCTYQGGNWEQLKNGCVDRCDVLRDPTLSASCKEESPFGCECGANRCWTGTACEAN